jgi:glyoxalase/bleomycin resistance protein/dioxygenase superfamily protein
VPGPDSAALYQQSWPDGEYRFFQLGFVVEDLLATAQKWVSTMGVGPFHIMPRTQGGGLYRGQQGTTDVQVAVAQAGPVQIELIEDFADGPSVFRERRLFSGASGLHQLCTVTPNFDAKRQHFLDLGYQIAGEITDPRYRVAYVDTVDDFGFYTEIVEDKPSFAANLARIAQTCAEWDGVTDPLRLLTRDGYETP